MKRTSGVLMHISSLFGDYSIGSFGDEAKYFIDFLKKSGFSYWQVLPFCMVDECNSPYKSFSSFGGNPYFVDLKKLHDKGLITDDELRDHKQQTPYSCEYVRLFHTRCKLLKKAAGRVSNSEEIESFIESDKYLSEFCEFMARKTANNNSSWKEWTIDKVDTDEVFMWKFIQFEFFKQWSEIKKYANENGIKIIGDIPIYVDYDSCDVYYNKDKFLLDERDNPTLVAGVPPDYFCPDGQLWGNPIYNWEQMKKDNYSWWTDRVEHMLKMFDGIRIDHFRGLSTYWAVPSGAATAKEGKWEIGPGKEFIDVIKNKFSDAFIIAEDLGDITDDVRELLKYSGFPGMRVAQFGFISNEDTPHLPHNYINNSVAYTGTHDNNTLLGYVWDLDEGTRKYLLEYCGYYSDDWNSAYDYIIRTVFATNAGLVIFPIQDLLGYGSDTRLNIPGKADGNWQFRITKEQLDGIDTAKYKKLNGLYKRI